MIYSKAFFIHKTGFGSEDGNYWIGLEELHQITIGGHYGLGVNLTNWEGATYWSYYSDFAVDSESKNYKLSVSGFDPESTGQSSNTGFGCLKIVRTFITQIFRHRMSFTSVDAGYKLTR